MSVDTSFPVRYAETDQMGIVHHSVYPVWFECGRTEFIRHYGIPYDELERLGLMLPLIGLSVTYKYPLRYGDTVVIRSSLAEANKIRLKIAYHVYREGSDKLCAVGYTEHAWTDHALKPVNIAKYKPDIFVKLRPMYDEATGEKPQA